MTKNNYNFPVVYWGEDGSTRARFAPLDSLSDELVVTTCMVFVSADDKVLLSKPPRGWGFPGGHLEPGETPQDCARREVYEETSVKIDNLRPIGAWKIEKVFDSDTNQKYPDLSHQLLFVADLAAMDDFLPSHESSARRLVPIDEVERYHHDFSSIAEILRYIKDTESIK